jgi:hypothetical protein
VCESTLTFFRVFYKKKSLKFNNELLVRPLIMQNNYIVIYFLTFYTNFILNFYANFKEQKVEIYKIQKSAWLPRWVTKNVHLNTILWFQANQSLLLLLNAVCYAEEQQIPILLSLIWPNLCPNSQSTILWDDHGNHYITDVAYINGSSTSTEYGQSVQWYFINCF